MKNQKPNMVLTEYTEYVDDIDPAHPPNLVGNARYMVRCDNPYCDNQSVGHVNRLGWTCRCGVDLTYFGIIRWTKESAIHKEQVCLDT